MRLTAPLIFAALLLATLYAISTIVTLRAASEAPALVGLSQAWSNPTSIRAFAVHCAAIVLAALPYAWVFDHIYGQFGLPIAAATSIAIWGAFGGPNVVVELVLGRADHPTVVLLALIQLTALPLLLWWLRRLPSNYRWSGVGYVYKTPM
jgi:hypothetical protein